MAFLRASSFWVLVILVIALLVLPGIGAQSPAPAPASDGVAIDQGIACVLMLAALVLTYLIH